MKIFFILVFLFIYPFVSFAEIDERKTDIYYANGILVSDLKAKDASLILETAVIDKIFSRSHFSSGNA